jgi:hypothetical protein
VDVATAPRIFLNSVDKGARVWAIHNKTLGVLANTRELALDAIKRELKVDELEVVESANERAVYRLEDVPAAYHAKKQHINY